jgi:hypothetical protein
MEFADKTVCAPAKAPQHARIPTDSSSAQSDRLRVLATKEADATSPVLTGTIP